MTSRVTDIAGSAIERVFSSMRKIFSEEVLRAVYPDVPAPRVTLDMPGSEPEPLHVFVWGTARDFDAESFLTGACMEASFHVWVTLVASASSSEEASRIANAYQAMALQLCLCDPLLGGLCTDATAPTVKEADSWADSSGRRHAGYLLDFCYSTSIQAAKEVANVLKENP